MPEPTPKQIEAEIKALEAAKEFAPHFTMFGDDNHAKIDLQIEYLRGEIDVTSAEFEEHYNQDEQSAILEAKDWEEGQGEESPSKGWETFKKKADPASAPKPKSKRK